MRAVLRGSANGVGLNVGASIAFRKRMPRRPLIIQSEYPYSITARSNNKEHFEAPLGICWGIFQEEIERTAERYDFRTHCFVLMSNHYHWLVSTPQANLDEGMQFFQTNTSKKLAKASRRINRIYGGRYRPSLICNSVYYANSIRYYYQNPLRAKVCTHVDQYPWSTRSPRSKIALHPCGLSDLIPANPDVLRKWLNEIPEGPFQDNMQKALRRAEFRFPRDPHTKLETDGHRFLISN